MYQLFTVMYQLVAVMYQLAAVMYAPCIANCLLDINNLSGAQTILMVVTAHMEYFMSGIISC